MEHRQGITLFDHRIIVNPRYSISEITTAFGFSYPTAVGLYQEYINSRQISAVNAGTVTDKDDKRLTKVNHASNQLHHCTVYCILFRFVVVIQQEHNC